MKFQPGDVVIDGKVYLEIINGPAWYHSYPTVGVNPRGSGSFKSYSHRDNIELKCTSFRNRSRIKHLLFRLKEFILGL